jgi:hypothetical protein
MNEEELKQIWNKDKAAVAPAIDFEAVQKNMRGWEGKLRRKIKIDIITNAAAYVLLIPAAVYYPEILYLAPFMILIWVWYLWETLRIYRQETNSSESGSTKEYLETKKRFLENYIQPHALHCLHFDASQCTRRDLYVGFFTENLGVTLTAGSDPDFS